jgi:hypothetical protein
MGLALRHKIWYKGPTSSKRFWAHFDKLIEVCTCNFKPNLNQILIVSNKVQKNSN